VGHYAAFDTVTDRGYTGHEHGDSFGLIHMNGRMYDAKLGRMLQADPFIQDPTNTQSYNRYSYVLNNPLIYTDPSGYFSLGKAVVGVFKVVAGAVRVYQGDMSGWSDIGQGIYQLNAAFDSGSDGGSASPSINISAGVAPGAFSSQVGPVQVGGTGSPGRVQQYRWDPTAGQVIAGTYSEMTRGNFANGAAGRTFSILLLGQPEERRQREDAQKGSGVIGYDADGVPIFDESHPKFHHYYGSNSCAKTTSGCTLANAKNGLLRYPAPGASGDPIVDEQTGFARPVGTVRHEVYDGGGQVINVTLEGRHLLHPGIVRRWVTQDALSVTVHTYGEGTGNFARANEFLSESLWRGVDDDIFNYMSPQ
jgi:RHS repeat-associated protein